jgi:uncharacterized protein
MTNLIDSEITSISNQTCIWENVKTLVLHVTNSCCLRCSYCFERHGQMEDMPVDMLHAIIDRAIDSVYFQTLVENVNHPKRKPDKNMSISFFGGEPLMRFDLVKDGVEYAKKNKPPEMNISFGITTNGVLLNKENIDYMAENNFSMILSIDGPADIHDTNRIFPDGSGSHAKILQNLPYLLEKMNRRITVRPSYTDIGVPKLFETVKYLVDELKFITVAAIPVIDSTQFGERINWEAVWPELIKQYWLITEWWYQECIVKGRNIDIKFIRDFGRDFLSRHIPVSGNACGTGFGYQAYGPDGYIYPCHRYVNDIDHEAMRICKYDNEMIENDLAKKFFIKREDFTSELDCKTCILEDTCSKGCNVVNLKLTKSKTIVPKEQCWFSLLQFRNGMRLLSKYGKDPRMIRKLDGQLWNIVNAALPKKQNKPPQPIIKSHPNTEVGQSVIVHRINTGLFDVGCGGIINCPPSGEIQNG